MKWAAVILIVLSLGVIGWGGWWIYTHRQAVPNKINQVVDIPRPLDKYTIDNLGKRTYDSQIFLDEPTATTAAYTVYKFHYDSDGKNVTGLAHIPSGGGPFPVIVQFRGFVPPENYQSGMGTAPSARVFTSNGFISLAPDFLGYGGSDKEANDVFESRFETYTTALNLLAAAEKFNLGNGKVGIWGHSNGGHIALTVLEITGKAYPTVLWAPVSRTFPYSIIFFTDDIPDHGKALRKVLANFEQTYDTELYSLTNYLDRIVAPIQLHQGGNDGTVPQKWSDDLASWFKDNKKDIDYFTYPSAGHSMEGSWDTVVARNIKFFKERL